MNCRIPKPDIVREKIRSIVVSAKESTDQRHKAFPEGAFLNHYIYYNLHDYLLSLPDFDKEKAREALLSESYRSISDISSGSPGRTVKHPFRKVIGISPSEVIKQWQGHGPGAPVAQNFPDFALRGPCLYKTVFEGKYFPKGGIKAAETSLATDLYQAFFYLGLSRVPEIKAKPAWDYDYACLLAFDATPDGNFLNVWNSLNSRVKKAFWEGANIYVMILRGS